MEELRNKNSKLIKEAIEKLIVIRQTIDDTTNNYQYYLESIKNEVFEKQDNETYEEAIKRGEGIIKSMDETERKRKALILEKGQETIIQIEIMKKEFKRIIEEYKEDEALIGKAKNELIDKVIAMEEMNKEDKISKIKLKIKSMVEEINNIQEESVSKEEEWRSQYSDYKERSARLERINNVITMEEMNKIEEWTNRKVGNILFNSDIDDWNKDTSSLQERILYNNQLIIIIEDSKGNKFGGYINSVINRVGSYIKDSKSFLFFIRNK
ncbi:hypothetical protein EHI8A_058560 [Entamoeba histolytica HM-1:IMSS-B]|uniref:TLDc domain-containing protein n=1 Tax=Entamoeba histolytica HM-1:IMSS-B TaxID=885319 RepID=M3TZ71_ENTH1|nr:hypothetical protein EHI8A_058560 [Entamoeba histolytica HM-1:IMSS-B]